MGSTTTGVDSTITESALKTGQLWHRVRVRTVSGVHPELAEGIESLPGWRMGVRQKKIETDWKIVTGGRKACREL
ncbi:hypothetical protein BHM03_00044771 [Ensete ventricosum]|nr:hypothetical protein BHM03_00044771 [Ensete ventricosum]